MSNENSPLLEWVSFPLVDYPRSSIILYVFLIFMMYILWQITVVEWAMPLFYILGMIFLLGSIISWFIPTRYRLWPDKVEITYLNITVRRAWTDFRCYYGDKRGVMLGTFPHQTRLDRFRGQSLRYSKKRDEKEPLFAILNEKIGKKA